MTRYRLEVWNRTHSSRRAIFGTVVSTRRNRVLKGAETIEIQVSAEDGAASSLTRGAVLRLQEIGGPKRSLWRLTATRKVRDAEGRLLLSLSADALWMDFRHGVVRQAQSSGRALRTFGLVDVSPNEYLTDVILPGYEGDAIAFASGVVDPLDGQSLNFEDTPPLAALRMLEEATGCEASFTLNAAGDTYTIDLLARVGRVAGAAEIRYRKNLQGLERFEDAADVVTRLYARGAGTLSLADATWEVASVSGTAAARVIAFSGHSPVWIQDALVGAYFYVPGKGAYGITASDADAGTITVDEGALGAVAAADVGYMATDAAGSRLEYLEHPAAVAEYGVRVGTTVHEASPDAENLVGNADLSEWSGGLPTGWSKIGAPAVAEETGRQYVQQGSVAGRVTAAAAEEGLLSPAFDVPTGDPLRPYLAILSGLTVESGRARLELRHSNGKTYPLEAQSGSEGAGVYLTLSAGPVHPDPLPAGTAQLAIVSHGGAAEFVLDCAMATPVLGSDVPAFVATKGAWDLWDRTAHELGERAEARLEYRVQVADLYAVAPEVFAYDELDLGDDVKLRDPDIDRTTVRIVEITDDPMNPGRATSVVLAASTAARVEDPWRITVPNPGRKTGGFAQGATRATPTVRSHSAAWIADESNLYITAAANERTATLELYTKASRTAAWPTEPTDTLAARSGTFAPVAASSSESVYYRIVPKDGSGTAGEAIEDAWTPSANPTGTGSVTPSGATLTCRYTGTTSQIIVRTPAGNRTFTGLSSAGGVVTYTAGVTLLDDGSQEAALAAGEVRGGYRVSYVYGQAQVDLYDGSLSGPLPEGAQKPTATLELGTVLAGEADVLLLGSLGDGVSGAMEYQYREYLEDETPGAFGAWTSLPALGVTLNFSRHPVRDRIVEAVVRDADGRISEVATVRVPDRREYVKRDTGTLADGIVDNAALAALAVTAAKLATGAVDNSKLAADAVTEGKLANSAVTSTKLAALAVTAGKLADGSVENAKIAAAAVDAAKIAAGAVESTKLADGAVTALKIAAGAVDSTKLANLAVTAAKLADGSVDNAKIAASAVTAGKIAAGAVGNAQLASSAVDAAKLADSAVTTAKLAAAAVDAGRLAASAVTAEKIASAAVDATKIATGATVLRRAPKLIVARKSSSQIGDPAAVAYLQGLGYDVTVNYAADVPACRAYDIVVVACANWSASEHNAFIKSLWEDGQRVWVEGNDSSSGLFYITATAANAAGFTPVPEPLAHPILSGLGAFTSDSDSGQKITGWVSYAKRLMHLSVDTAAAAVLEVPHPSGGVVVHATAPRFGMGGSTTDTFCHNVVAYLVGTTVRPSVGELGSAYIADSAITALKIAAGAVDSGKLADLAVTAAKLAAGSVDNGKLANDAVTAGKIAAGAVGSMQLADGAITDLKVAAGAISSAKLADLAVTAAKIASGAVGGTQLAAAAVSTSKIADNAVTTAKIPDSAITALKVAAGAVDATRLADLAVTAAKLADGAVDNAKLANDAVTAGKIAAGAVGSMQIADGAVTTSKIPDSAITALKVAAGAVDSSKLADLAVTAAKIASGAVGTTQLANGAVTTAKIPDSAITALKVAAGAVDATRLADLAVTAAKLADGSVDNAKIATGAVTAAKIAAGTITANEIAAGAIATSHLAAGAVTAAKIATGTITANEIAAGAIGTDELGANAVTAGKIASGTITANEIAAGAIATAQLAAGAVTSAKITAGAVTATELASNAVVAGKIASGAVTTDKLAAGAVTAAKIAAGTITANEIAAGAIGAAQLAAGTITADKIQAGAIVLRRTPKVVIARKASQNSSDPPALSRLQGLGYDVTLDLTATLEDCRAYDIVVIDCSHWSASEHNAFIKSLWEDGQRVWVSGDDSTSGLFYVTSATGGGMAGFTPVAELLAHPILSGITSLSADGSTGVRITGWVSYAKRLMHQAEDTTAAAMLEVPHPSGGVVVHMQAPRFDKSEAAATTLFNNTVAYLVGSGFKASVGEIGGTFISDGAIATDHLAAGAVTAAKIAAGAITANEIAAGAIATAQLAAGAVTAAKIAAGTITANEIAASTITAAKIAGGAITATQLASGAVTTDKLAAGAVTAAKIAAGTITANEIAAGAIATAQLAAGAVTAAKIAAGTITANELAAGAVVAGKIAAGAVAAAELASGAVTTAKLDALAVTAEKIASGAVATDKLAANAVTAAKIAAGTITATQMASEAVTTDKLAAGAVTAAKIAAGTITANELAAGSVATAQLAAGAVSADKIAAGALTIRRAPKIIVARKHPNLAVAPAVAYLQGLGYDVTENYTATLEACRAYDIVVIDCHNYGASSSDGAFIEALWEDGQRVWVTGNDSSSTLFYITANTLNPDGFTPVPESLAHPILSGLGTFSNDADSGQKITGWVSYAKRLMHLSVDTAAAAVLEVPHASGGVVLHVTAPRFGMGGSATDTFCRNAVAYLVGTMARTNVGEIGGTYIADGAIATDHLAAGAVTAAKIAAGTITANELAAGSVAASELAAGAVIADKIASSAVTTDKLASRTITAEKIASGAITANEIAAGAIATAQLAAGAVTAAKIAAGTITATEIAANAVTTDKVAAGAITAAKIQVDSLSAITADLGTVTAGLLKDVAETAAVRLSTGYALPVGASRYLDLTASGAAPFLKHDDLELRADGTRVWPEEVKNPPAIGSASCGGDWNGTGTDFTVTWSTHNANDTDHDITIEFYRGGVLVGSNAGLSITASPYQRTIAGGSSAQDVAAIVILTDSSGGAIHQLKTPESMQTV